MKGVEGMEINCLGVHNNNSPEINIANSNCIRVCVCMAVCCRDEKTFETSRDRERMCHYGQGNCSICSLVLSRYKAWMMASLFRSGRS